MTKKLIIQNFDQLVQIWPKIRRENPYAYISIKMNGNRMVIVGLNNDDAKLLFGVNKIVYDKIVLITI